MSKREDMPRMSWWRKARQRPLELPRLAGRGLRFAVNGLFWRWCAGPAVRVGRNLRTETLLCFMAERPAARIAVGDDVVLHRDVRLHAWGQAAIRVGSTCTLGSCVRLYARDRIELGHHVLVSWDALLLDFDAHSLDPAERARELDAAVTRHWPARVPAPAAEPVRRAAPIRVGDHVWIGARAIVLKGVTIGDGAVVAAGAVVVADVAPGTVVAGNPARPIQAGGSTSGGQVR